MVLMTALETRDIVKMMARESLKKYKLPETLKVSVTFVLQLEFTCSDRIAFLYCLSENSSRLFLRCRFPACRFPVQRSFTCRIRDGNDCS